jgi:hypothetical protein
MFKGIPRPAPAWKRALIGVTRVLGLTLALSAAQAFGQTSVLTFHNNNERTGWNPNETVLSQNLVNGQVPGKTFGSLGTVSLNQVNSGGTEEQIDGQPLVVSSSTPIDFGNGKSSTNIIYLASENNTVFAIDGAASAYSGTNQILGHVSLGASVAKPTCSNNANTVGVNSTSVIDPDTKTIYVVSYQTSNGAPAYFLYALGYDLSVKDHIEIKGSSNNITFDPSLQRQRPALLYSSHSHLITAGFASYCDSPSRGWVFALPALDSSGSFPQTGQHALLLDYKANSTLSSVWMSGAGIAEGGFPDQQGRYSLYFVTGNTHGGYDANSNKANSLIKLYPDLSFQKLFTPTNEADLDAGDLDFGAGGLVLVNPQFQYAVSAPTGRAMKTVRFTQAYAAGKDGNFYAVDRQSLKGISQEMAVSCHCSPTSFMGADGKVRLVMSTAVHDGDNTTTLREFMVDSCLINNNTSSDPVCQANLPLAQTLSQSGSNSLTMTTKLVQRGPSVSVPTIAQRDGGGFTSVSSNGAEDGTGIIWLVTRAELGNGNLHLFAYTPGTLVQLGPHGGWLAGAWSHYSGANSNTVPTVANGRVYVASDNVVYVFGSN